MSWRDYQACIAGICIFCFFAVLIVAFLAPDESRNTGDYSVGNGSNSSVNVENASLVKSDYGWYSEDPCPECGESGIYKYSLYKSGVEVGYHWECTHCGAEGDQVWF